jgi:hypothetical protein
MNINTTSIKLRQFGFKPNNTGSMRNKSVEFVSYPFEDSGRYFIMAKTETGTPSKAEIPQTAIDLAETIDWIDWSL